MGRVLADSRQENKCCMQQKRCMISVLHVTHWRKGGRSIVQMIRNYLKQGDVACDREVVQHLCCVQHLFYSNPHPSMGFTLP